MKSTLKSNNNHTFKQLTSEVSSIKSEEIFSGILFFIFFPYAYRYIKHHEFVA